MSADMLNYLVDVNHLSVDDTIVKRVCELITSGHPDPAATGGPSVCASAPGTNRHPQFLRDIVANGRNSVDVDKFDYIERDCLNCGLKNSADFGRLIMYSKVIDDEICFKASEVLNLYELFHTRASLHQRVYTHRKAKAIEYMVVDCLLHADAAWGGKISSAILSPQNFQRLDDTVLKRIEWSDDPKLKDAQAILQRLRRRELYRYVNEFAVPGERLAHWKAVTPADVVSCQDPQGGVQLRPEDVIVHNLKIDWTSKNENPVNSIKFFRDYDSTDKFAIPKEKVSSLIPDTFLERKVRVFSKRADQEAIDTLDRAFLAFQQREYGSALRVDGTPAKASRKRSLTQRLSAAAAEEEGPSQPGRQ
jgi:HD superfamily phosphohydrolase